MGVTRHTRQKDMLDAEVRRKKAFFTADDLFESAHKKDATLGIATVYRYLKTAVKSRSIYAYSCGKTTIYSTASNNHCHFECERTGKVVHFTIDDLRFLQNKIPGSISSISLVVRGVCNECCENPTQAQTAGSHVSNSRVHHH